MPRHLTLNPGCPTLDYQMLREISNCLSQYPSFSLSESVSSCIETLPLLISDGSGGGGNLLLPNDHAPTNKNNNRHDRPPSSPDICFICPTWIINCIELLMLRRRMRHQQRCWPCCLNGLLCQGRYKHREGKCSDVFVGLTLLSLLLLRT